MSFQTIVAIDLGKFKSVLCVMDVATKTHRFMTVDYADSHRSGGEAACVERSDADAVDM